MQTTDQYPNGAIAGDPLKSDTADLTKAAAGFYVGVAGDVKINDIYGNATVFKAVPVGFQYFVGISRLWSTGTAATNIVLFLP